MQKSKTSKFKVTPYNIRNGVKAPYYVVDATNKDEGEKVARQTFKSNSSLSKYDNWEVEVEKL